MNWKGFGRMLFWGETTVKVLEKTILEIQKHKTCAIP